MTATVLGVATWVAYAFGGVFSVSTLVWLVIDELPRRDSRRTRQAERDAERVDRFLDKSLGKRTWHGVDKHGRSVSR